MHQAARKVGGQGGDVLDPRRPAGAAGAHRHGSLRCGCGSNRGILALLGGGGGGGRGGDGGRDLSRGGLRVLLHKATWEHTAWPRQGGEDVCWLAGYWQQHSA